MKNQSICIISLFLVISCSPSKSELFKETDIFVESLETTYESYGAFGGTKHSKITSDSLYQVTPIGRLINVKILKVVEKKVYDNLKDDLQEHYKDDNRVNDVYINNGGTIMIDCRN